MAADIAGLKVALKAAQDQALSDCIADVAEDIVRQNYVDNQSQAFLDFIKTAELTIPTGGIVVTGSATTQSNPSPVIVADGLS